MSSGGGGEKTEKPTPKRLKEARKEGQVARTQELGAWVAVLLVSLAAGPLLRHEGEAMQGIMTRSLRAVEHPSTSLALELLGDASTHAFLALLVLSGAVLVVGVLATVAQGGFYLSPKLAKPDPKKLDPFKGAKRVFGPHSLWEGAKMLVKSAVVALLAYSAITAMMPLVGGLVPVSMMLATTWDHVVSMFRSVALAGLVMAAVDYAMARRRTGKQTRMSKEEIKQEHKQAEGDPLVKSAIRSRQLAAARSRMLNDIADADVLLVNPTHVAVALKYDAERGAPRVVARGAGAIAAKIRERAAEERVPLVRDVPLARAIYRSCEVGQEIPRELWAAVAQVLAFVISRRTQGQYGGEHRTPRATAELPEVPRVRRRRAAVAAPDSSAPPPPGR